MKIQFPACFTSYSLFDSRSTNELNYNTHGTLTASSDSVTTGWYDRGVTFNAGNSSSETQQQMYFRWMMLGSDTSQKVNAGYFVPNGVSNNKYVFSVTDDTGTIHCNLNRFSIMQPFWRDTDMTHPMASDQNYVPTTTTPITLTLPLWPTIRLMDINSNYFSYNKAPIQIGQGLPIASNIVSNGTLHISAKYSVQRIVSASTPTGIKIDVANMAFNDFNDDHDDRKFFNGYEGNVDPDTTSNPIVALRNYEIDNTTKTVELSIPVKSGDDVWLRLAPINNDGGYFARFTDLNVKLVTQ